MGKGVEWGGNGRVRRVVGGLWTCGGVNCMYGVDEGIGIGEVGAR